jgi:hypothetical protein
MTVGLSQALPKQEGAVCLLVVQAQSVTPLFLTSLDPLSPLLPPFSSLFSLLHLASFLFWVSCFDLLRNIFIV